MEETEGKSAILSSSLPFPFSMYSDVIPSEKILQAKRQTHDHKSLSLPPSLHLSLSQESACVTRDRRGRRHRRTLSLTRLRRREEKKRVQTCLSRDQRVIGETDVASL